MLARMREKRAEENALARKELEGKTAVCLTSGCRRYEKKREWLRLMLRMPMRDEDC